MRDYMVTLLLALMVIMASAIPNPVPPPADVLTTTPRLTWTVQSAPNTPEITLTGTIQEIYTQLKSINPTYDSDWANIMDAATSTESSTENKQNGFETANAKHTLKCAGYGGAYPEDIWDGIQHLRQVHGKPRNGPGPGNCGRVACKRGGAVFWCNNDNKPRTLPSFNNIADGAQVVLDGCNNGYRQGFGGVLDHPDLWKVVVRYEKC
ncbi:hypothetical protein BDV12DRAFT_197756 [Aspergillus spectabilis]